MILSKLRARLSQRGAIARIVVFVAAASVLYAMARAVLTPFFKDLHTMGFHDWDSGAAYREITVMSLLRYHELPWWHPYLCGGFPAWAYSEGATNLVSPYLPLYLTLPMTVALRLEVVGAALTSLVATYLLASRHTKSIALRALLAGVYTFNGRWALQTASGHTWHLQYAWVPLALYFLDRSFERGRTRDAVYAGAVLALILYLGGIYPLPHAALLLTLYALATAITTRRIRPIGTLSLAGLCAIGFSAPKLFPAVDLMRRFPRTLESTEAVGVEQVMQMLANPEQSFYRGVAAVPAYGWHEWGIYVGWPFVVAMAFALLFGRGRREGVLNVLGILFWVLGCGAFHPDAPWSLLHKVPVFASQHVPSRFMLTGVLLLGLAFIAFVGRRADRWIARAPLVDLLILIPVYFVVMDIAAVSRKTTEVAFVMEIPKVAWHDEFRQITHATYNYSPPDAWAGPSFPMMRANEGFVGCYSVPNNAEPKGVIAADGAGYRGEASVEGGAGEARVTKWTPNSAEVDYTNVTPGSVVVYNMNYDPSWRADGAPAIDFKHAVAARVTGASGKIRFRYFPRTLWPSLFVFALTVFAALFAPRMVAKAIAKRRGAPAPLTPPLRTNENDT